MKSHLLSVDIRSRPLCYETYDVMFIPNVITYDVG